MAKIVCVQNNYNILHRSHDGLIDDLAMQGIAFVPFFPAGGFRPIRSAALEQVAADLGTSTRQVALAWLLHRAPNVLLIAGTSSADHLHENLTAATLRFAPHIKHLLDRIGASVEC